MGEEEGLANLHGQLDRLVQEKHSGLNIQRLGNILRVDMAQPVCEERMFLRYSPLMFFTISWSTSSSFRVELITYNEEVFQAESFNPDAVEEVHNFVANKFGLSFSSCSGIKREHIRSSRLPLYLGDEQTIYERFGDSLILRSVDCRRLLEDSAAMDLCTVCKGWLLSREAPSPSLPEVKFKMEETLEGDREEEEDGQREDDETFPDIGSEEEEEEEEEKEGREEMSIGQPLVPLASGRKSLVWEHFLPSPQDNTAQCNLCQRTVKMGATRCTTGLLNHTRRHHPDEWAVMEVTRLDRFQGREEEAGQGRVGQAAGGKARIAKRSLVWRHFAVSEKTKEEAVCQVCFLEVSTRGGSTTGLWSHLRSQHPRLEGQEEGQENMSMGLHQEDGNMGLHKIRSRSLVWKFFRKTVPAMAVCNLCGKEICTVGNNTSGMIKHLSSIHQDLNFQDMLEEERVARQARKDLQKEKRPGPARVTQYPKSSPAWKYFTASSEDRDSSTCSLCSAQISCVKKNTSGMLKHLVRWHPDTNIVLNKKEECSQCDRKFFFKKTLIKHLKIDHGAEYKKYKCPEEGCDVFFRLEKGKLMRKHLTDVHKHTLNLKEGMYPCEKCGKKFRTFDILTKHIKGVHESVHVPCYICAKLVKEGTPMEHHIKYVHLQPNTFTCKQPGCSFSTRHKDTLLDHQTLHTGTKRWCCGTCGKEHRLRSGLYLCEKNHQGYEAWQHQCEQCSKKFISKQKLIMHIRMHTGEKPFCCPVCRVRSARMSNLNAHIKKSHGLTWKEAEIRFGISAKTGQALQGESPLSLPESSTPNHLTL